MPAMRKARLENFSFSVMRPMALGMMINRVHQPSKKMSRLKRPRALPPKMIPRAMMAMPQMMGFALVIFSSPLWANYSTIRKMQAQIEYGAY